MWTIIHIEIHTNRNLSNTLILSQYPVYIYAPFRKGFYCATYFANGVYSSVARIKEYLACLYCGSRCRIAGGSSAIDISVNYTHPLNLYPHILGCIFVLDIFIFRAIFYRSCHFSCAIYIFFIQFDFSEWNFYKSVSVNWKWKEFCIFFF